MPGAVSLTGADVVTLNGRVFSNFASGDVALLAFNEDLVNVTASKDGNIVYAQNEPGHVSKFKLMLLLGSSDDQYMNSLLASQISSLSEFILIIGSFVKRVGDGQGNITNVIYNVIGGVVDKFPEASTNTTGEAKQSIATWDLTFGNNTRSIM